MVIRGKQSGPSLALWEHDVLLAHGYSCRTEALMNAGDDEINLSIFQCKPGRSLVGRF
jgi:uncharacterized cupin superfamily protein